MKESEEVPQSSPSSTGVGARLVAARGKWGLSVQEAAQCLNLNVDIIIALEQDAYERLPAGSTFTAGYLRAYAKLLKLDPEEMVADTGFEAEQTRAILYPNEPLNVAPRSPLRKRGILLLRGLLLAGLLALAVAGLVAFTQLPEFSVDQLIETVGSFFEVSLKDTQ